MGVENPRLISSLHQITSQTSFLRTELEEVTKIKPVSSLVIFFFLFSCPLFCSYFFVLSSLRWIWNVLRMSVRVPSMDSDWLLASVINGPYNWS